jgi:hypothetical protein
MFVNQGEGAPHIAVAQSREPPRAFFRQPFDMAPHRIDEHHLANALKHRLAAGAFIPRGIDCLSHDLQKKR